MSMRLVLIVLVGVTIGSISYAQDLTVAPEVKRFYPKLQSVLAELEEKYAVEGKTHSENFAKQRNIHFEEGMVTVILVPAIPENITVIDEVHLLSLGAKITGRSKHFLRAKIPIENIDKIANTFDTIQSNLNPTDKAELPNIIKNFIK